MGDIRMTRIIGDISMVTIRIFSDDFTHFGYREAVEKEFESIGEAASVALIEAKEHNKNRADFGLELYYDLDKLNDMTDTQIIEYVWADGFKNRIQYIMMSQALEDFLEKKIANEVEINQESQSVGR